MFIRLNTLVLVLIRNISSLHIISLECLTSLLQKINIKDNINNSLDFTFDTKAYDSLNLPSNGISSEATVELRNS